MIPHCLDRFDLHVRVELPALPVLPALPALPVLPALPALPVLVRLAALSDSSRLDMETMWERERASLCGLTLLFSLS